MTDDERQAVVDGEHLRILSIGYVISAGCTAFFSLFGLLYGLLGVLIATSPPGMGLPPGQSATPEFVGMMLGVIGFGLFVLLLAGAFLKFLVARSLRRRGGRVFCMVVAALACFEIPYGTALGVFTFLVLTRASVARMFETRAHGTPG